MDLNLLGEIKHELAILTSLVTSTVELTMPIKLIGELKQMILSLTNLVASTMKMNHSKDNGEEKWSNRGPNRRLQDRSPLDRTRARVRHIFSESTYARPLCLKCGGEGHIAKHCCRSLVCFACEEIGHKSRDCKEIAKTYTDKSKALSFAMKFNIGKDGERQGLQKSQWIWKKKENQEEKKNRKHERLMEGEIRGISDGNKQDDTMETYKVERCGNIEQGVPLTVTTVQKRPGIAGTEEAIKPDQLEDVSHEETKHEEKAEEKREIQETEVKDRKMIEQIEDNSGSPKTPMMHNLRLSGGKRRPRRSIRMQMRIAGQYVRVQ